MLRELEPNFKVGLATEPVFRIGDIVVTPALRQVERGGEQATLEPRVMQVLVALGQARGGVISRYELVERCWDGRIVGENAIQRVISRIRQLAETLGGFEVETIIRVGYRLIVHDVPVVDDTTVFVESDLTVAPITAVGQPAPFSGSANRRLIIATLAVAAMGGSVVAWQALTANDGNVRAAAALIAKAHDAQLAGLAEQTVQAVAYLKHATELDPTSAVAWGHLALSYQQLIESADPSEQAAHAAWSRAAAQRALALDPRNVAARNALASIQPNFRHWAENERRLRALDREYPGTPQLGSALGWLLCDVGRWRESIACFRQTLAGEPFQPLNQMLLAWGLWGGGELAEAERRLDDAAKLWPGHRSIWLTRFEFLATMGQAAAAEALVDDIAKRPMIAAGDEPPPYATLRSFATAMRTQAPADIDAASVAIAGARGRRQLSTNSCVTYLSSLGFVDAAFDRLELFYFGDARDRPGPLSRRKTSILFSAKGAALRRDQRFAELTRRLGLDDYWQITGTKPDIRA